MVLLTTVFLLVSVLLTATLSGVFGMVGGMVLLWLLMLVMPLTTAIAVQGILQLAANLSRGYVARRWIDWHIVRNSTIGLAGALAMLSLVEYAPDAAIASLCVGLLPVFCFLPRRWISLNASRPLHAMTCGFVSGALNLGVGVAGPVVDIFFTRTDHDRRSVIGTKATLQVLSHIAKIAFYSSSLDRLSGAETAAIALSIPVSFLGSVLGHRILLHMTDEGFRRGTVGLVTAVGAFYFARGLYLLHGG